jgi:chromate transporter
MLLPGPEAHQLAIYIGWLMHRWPGAIIAGGLFVLPGIVSIMALSVIYAAYGSVPVVTALLLGLKAAVLAIVLQAVQRVGSRALKSQPMLVLAALAFIGIFFFRVPFPLIVVTAGIIGFVAARAGSTAFQVGGNHGGGRTSAEEGLLGAELPEHARPSVGRALRVSALWLALWLLPGWARHGGDDAGAADHGRPVRRLSRRLSRSGHLAADAGRRMRRAVRIVVHFCAVFSVDRAWRAIYRKVA